MEETILLRGFLGFIDIITLFIFIVKIEKIRVTIKFVIRSLIICLMITYLIIFLDLVFKDFFPYITSILGLIMLIAASLTFLSKFLNNSLRRALAITINIYIILTLIQVTAFPLIYLIGLFKPYTGIPLNISFVVQGWTIMILLFFFDKFSKYIYKWIYFMEKNIFVALLVFASILMQVLVVKIALEYLVIDSNTLAIFAIGITIIIGFSAYMIYKWFLKSSIKEKEVKEYVD